MQQLTGKELLAVAGALRSLELPYPIRSIGEMTKIVWDKPRGGQAAFHWMSGILSIEPVETNLPGELAEQFKQKMLYTKVPAIAHELRHAQQWLDWGAIRFFLNNLPIIQSFRMEKEAYEVEEAARKQLGLAEELTL